MLVGRVLDEGVPFGIIAVIYQESLQGAVGKKNFEELAAFFGTQGLYHPKTAWRAIGRRR